MLLFVLSSFFFFFFVAYSQRSQIGCLPYFRTWYGLNANLGCRSETCCTRLAQKYRTQKNSQKVAIWHHRTTCRAMSSQLRHIDYQKKLLSSNISSTCPYNMVNFGLLAAEIVSLVCRTPANFKGFRFLAALLHGI